MPVMLKQTTEQTEVARIALRGEARAASRGTAGGEVEDRHLRVCGAASEDAQPKTPAMWPILTGGDADGSAQTFNQVMKNGEAEVRPPGMKNGEEMKHRTSNSQHRTSRVEKLAPTHVGGYESGERTILTTKERNDYED